MNEENILKTGFLSNFKRYFAEKSDRIVLYSALNTLPNATFAIFKIGVGLFYLSFWFLTFGGYYLALLAIRLNFLRAYHHVRTTNETVTERIREEKHYLFDGGLYYAGLGFFFTLLSFTLYMRNQNEHYTRFIAISIATIGFVKIIAAIISWFNTRKLKSPLISYLKALSLADGLLAIVMTQYALLSYQGESDASTTTGIFGMGIGTLLIVIGFVIALRSRHLKKQIKRAD